MLRRVIDWREVFTGRPCLSCYLSRAMPAPTALAMSPTNAPNMCSCRLSRPWGRSYSDPVDAACSTSQSLFCHCTPSGFDGGIHVSSRFGVRVGDRYTPELCPSNFVRRLSCWPLRVV